MSYPHYSSDCGEHHDLVCDFGGQRPNIVVLCGSTRFYDEFQKANYNLTMQGAIVLSVGFYPHAKAEHGHGEGVGHDSAEKVALDELHKRKIDLADEVLVLNVGGYTGESTRGEIAYARSLDKPVRFLETTADPGAHDCSFPCNPPGGTMWNPGPCSICGKTWDRAQAEKALAEAQSAMAATEATNA